MSVIKFPLLFVTGFAAGLVDAMAGGGGIVTLPVLLGIGMQPQIALGTNKLQATFGSGSAMLHFTRGGAVDLRACAVGIIWTALGAAIGTMAVQTIHPAFLRRVIPVLLVAIALFMLFSPRLGTADVRERMRKNSFFVLFGLLLGFYDGFFGPAAGTFWAMAFVLFLGFNLIRATAYTKVMNFASNFVSLVFFLGGGFVSLPEGIVMGLGQFAGARIGSRMVMSRGSHFIRPVFITMALAVSIRLLWQNFR